MSDEHAPLLREFHIQRMVNGRVQTLTVLAENISAAKLKADEMAGGNVRGGKR